MPCCAAMGCSTRPGQKKMLHRFPRDPDRRQEWVIQVKRKNWTPRDHSYLCEDHFEEQQYELYRVDNRRQLKPYAIPTRFGCNKKEKKPCKRPRKEFAEHSYASTAADGESSAAAGVCQSTTPPAPEPASEPPNEKGESTATAAVCQSTTPPGSEPAPVPPIKKKESSAAAGVCQSTTPPAPEPAPVPPNKKEESSAAAGVCQSTTPPAPEPAPVPPNENGESSAAAGVCQSTTLPAPEPAPVSPIKKEGSYGSSSSSHEEKDPASVGALRPMCAVVMPVEEDNAATSALATKALVCTKTTYELLHQIEELKKKLAKEKCEKRKLLEQMKTQEMKLSKVFNADQIAKLSHKNHKGAQWSDETVKRALQLRQVCGSAGYEMLLALNQPLPSIRSLQRITKLRNDKNSADLSNGEHIGNSFGISHDSDGKPPEQKESTLDP